MINYRKFQCKEVKNIFDKYPKDIKPKMLFLRELIFNVASRINEVGPLEETIKWGEPSYVTSETKSGSTIRIDWKKGTPENYYMYFNCKTALVKAFKKLYGSLFTYGGNRSLIFHKDAQLPLDALSECIAMALTYRLSKKRR